MFWNPWDRMSLLMKSTSCFDLFGLDGLDWAFEARHLGALAFGLLRLLFLRGALLVLKFCLFPFVIDRLGDCVLFALP
ncbi:hypothetical protein BDW75DRAFT_200899 [Aspergillus navahoensis]